MKRSDFLKFFGLAPAGLYAISEISMVPESFTFTSVPTNAVCLSSTQLTHRLSSFMGSSVLLSIPLDVFKKIYNREYVFCEHIAFRVYGVYHWSPQDAPVILLLDENKGTKTIDFSKEVQWSIEST